MKVSKAELKRQQRKKEMQEKGYWFTLEQINHLVKEAKKIGFEPVKHYSKEKEFNPDSIMDCITFRHLKTGNDICLEKSHTARFDILNDNISDMLFTSLFEEVDRLYEEMNNECY